jgi:Zn-dependent alcohol dehydrogenase
MLVPALTNGRDPDPRMSRDMTLDHLISGRIKLDQTNDGFAALKSGAPVRQLLEFAA